MSQETKEQLIQLYTNCLNKRTNIPANYVDIRPDIWPTIRAYNSDYYINTEYQSSLVFWFTEEPPLTLVKYINSKTEYIPRIGRKQKINFGFLGLRSKNCDVYSNNIKGIEDATKELKSRGCDKVVDLSNPLVTIDTIKSCLNRNGYHDHYSQDVNDTIKGTSDNYYLIFGNLTEKLTEEEYNNLITLWKEALILKDKEELTKRIEEYK